jgi:hypothetical protein
MRTLELSARQPLRSGLHNVWEQRAARSAMPLATAAPVRARLCEEKPKEMLNVNERSLQLQ